MIDFNAERFLFAYNVELFYDALCAFCETKKKITRGTIRTLLLWENIYDEA